MNPRQSRSCRIVVATAVFVVLKLGATANAQFGPAPVVVSEVQVRDLTARQVYVGTVLPARRSSIGSAVDGRVIEFPVTEGDFVKKGRLLAQMRTESVSQEVAAARAEFDLRREELSELQNGSRPEELAAARAGMLAAKAFSDYRATQLKRAKALFERNAINEEELHEVEAEAESALQLHRKAEETWKLTEAGPRAERITQAKAQMAMQEAIWKNVEIKKNNYTVNAYFDGFVVKEHTEVGQWLKRGDLVVEVVALNVVDVEVHVLERHVSHISRGSEVFVELNAIPDRKFNGHVERIVPQADVRARTFPVKIRVKNEITDGNALIKSGMLARAMLPTGPLRKSLLVPKDALVLGGPQPTVFVVDVSEKRPSSSKDAPEASSDVDPNSGKARPVPVTLGEASGRLIEVKGKLKSGDKVVVRGNERLRPGQDVVITKTLWPDAAPRANATER